MPWDTIIIAVATILAAVLAVLLTRYLSHRRNGTKWKLLDHKDIPIWVISRVYGRGFYKKGLLDKYHPIGQDTFSLRGTVFEYLVKITDYTITEPIAKIRHLKVFRRKKR